MQVQIAQTNHNLTKFTLTNGTVVECDISHVGEITKIFELLNGAGNNKTSLIAASNEPNNFHACTLVEHINNVIRGIRASKDGTSRSKTLSISRLEKICEFLIRKKETGGPDRLASSLGMNDVDDIHINLEQFLIRKTGRPYKPMTMTAYFQLFNRLARMAAERELIKRPLKIKYNNHTSEDMVTPVIHKDDLKEILNGWIYKDYNTENTKINSNAESWKFWLIPLGLFTGARLNELCQLNIRDISKDNSGIWTVEVTNRLRTQNCKTSNSQRKIPLHPTLIEMGFLDFYAEQKERFGARTQLFPELIYSNSYHYSRQPSRFFSGKNTGDGYMGRLMIPQDRQPPSFRSLRRTFAETLANEGTPLSCVAVLLGHQDETTEMTLKHYVKKTPNQAKHAILVDGLIYDIDFSHIHWRHYKPLVESQRNRAVRGRRSK